MPIDQPINPKKSDVELSKLSQGDTVTVTYQSRDKQRRSFNGTVKRTSTFNGGTQVTLENGAKIYGDFYPPIVRTPAGEELRLYTIESNNSQH
jgi:hypothetical protein